MSAVAGALAAAATLAAIATTLFLAWLAATRARLPYENGRHSDAVNSAVHDESAVTVYALLALTFAVVAALLSWLTLRRWKRV